MDLAKVLAELHAELENLNAAINSLERLQETPRRRGRPPGSRNIVPAQSERPVRTGRPEAQSAARKQTNP
jgi:hypothetical protein